MYHISFDKVGFEDDVQRYLTNTGIYDDGADENNSLR